MLVDTFVSLESLTIDVWWGVKVLNRVFLNVNVQGIPVHRLTVVLSEHGAILEGTLSGYFEINL
jgi:hypothetical protein